MALPICPQCNKISHPNRVVARAQALMTAGANASTLDIYECPAGNGLHIGHNRRTRRRPPLMESRKDRMLILPRFALAKEVMSQ